MQRPELATQLGADEAGHLERFSQPLGRRQTPVGGHLERMWRLEARSRARSLVVVGFLGVDSSRHLGVAW